MQKSVMNPACMSIRTITIPVVRPGQTFRIRSKNPLNFVLRNPPPRQVLTELEVVFKGGVLDGREGAFNHRDAHEYLVSRHTPGRMMYDRYVRTAIIDPATGRTVFKLDGWSTLRFPSISPLRRLGLSLRLVKPRVVVDTDHCNPCALTRRRSLWHTLCEKFAPEAYEDAARFHFGRQPA